MDCLTGPNLYISGMSEKAMINISIPRRTHFITGIDGALVMRFRPYTEQEHIAMRNGNGLNPEQTDRIEMSFCEPGDIVIDLGSRELNTKFADLLNVALSEQEPVYVHSN
jgi:hypothetical protein